MCARAQIIVRRQSQKGEEGKIIGHCVGREKGEAYAFSTPPQPVPSPLVTWCHKKGEEEREKRGLFRTCQELLSGHAPVVKSPLCVRETALDPETRFDEARNIKKEG